MKKAKRTAARKRKIGARGRPPSGPNGSRASDNPQVAVRVPAKDHETFLSITAKRGWTQAETFTRAMSLLRRSVR